MQKIVLIFYYLHFLCTIDAFPGLDKRIPDALKRQRKLFSEASAVMRSVSAEEKEMKVIALQNVLKEEGIVYLSKDSIEKSRESKDSYIFFEVTQASSSDCHTNTGRVQGLEAGRCMNTLSTAANNGASAAQAMSEMWIKPNNEGFPIMVFFHEHGCNWDNIVHTSRMRKRDFGFPSNYSGGNCIPIYEGTASEPAFHMNARWTNKRHQPDYNAIMDGYDGKFAGCMRQRYTMYSMYSADMCMEDRDIDGKPTGLYTKADVSNCGNEGVRSVEFWQYSDPDCTFPVGSPDSNHSKHCVFDIDDFNIGLNNEGYTYIDFATYDCHKVPTEISLP